MLLFLSVSIAIKFSSRFFRSINNLITASQSIGGGNFDVKVPEVKTDKDLEQLNKNFNLMTERLKNQQDKLLLNERHEAGENVARKLAHEIKNPLASIIGAAQLLENSNVKNQKTLTQIIHEEAKRIESIVDRVQLLGEINRLDFEVLNIHDVIDKVKRSASQGYGSHVSFEENYDPSIPDVNGDFELLTQAFHNIIKNSCEAVGKKGGRITIKTSFYSGLALGSIGEKNKKLQLMITFSDNGPGVSKNIISDIFDPFSTTKMGGSGLGLPLVAKIISEHGGFVELDDMSEGACFKIYLPAGDAFLSERMH